MKKITLWKATALILLIAVCLPLIPKTVPPTEAVAVTTVAPLPYAMEQYGQCHTGIYSTKESITADGKAEPSYTLMNSFNDQVGNFAGVFVSPTENGTATSEPATEFVPDLLEIRGTYDDTYVYFHVQTITRTSENGYGIKLNFGFNFGANQANAQESTYTAEFSLAAGETEKSGTDYYIKTETAKEATTDSSGTYYLNATIYEFRVAWEDIAPEGKKVDTDFDRMYLSGALRYFDGTTDMYWVYGVPNNVTLPSGATVGTAFGAGAGTYTPNVVEFLGSKGSFTAAPEFAEVKRTDKNATKDREFSATLSLTGAKKADVAEAGIVYAEDLSALAGKSLTLEEETAKISKTENAIGETVLNFTVPFAIGAANYEKYFSLRSFVKYTDGTVVYGTAYSNTPAYFDAEDVAYTEYLYHLMIGNSFATYFLDEIVQIAKADKIYLTIARSYKSGASAYENWTFLVNDFSSDEYEVLTRKVCSPALPNTQNRGNFTLEEILAYADWTSISSHDRSDGVWTDAKTTGLDLVADTDSILSGILHLQKLFRYLEVNYPDAKLYFKQPWSFQLGYGYQKGTVKVENGVIVAGTKTSGHDPAKRMESYEKQTAMYENIADACLRYAELSGIPRIPCGDAWQIARANPLIGDTLCNKWDAAANKDITDYYHEGDVGGGQYLNAAVYYEVLTGNDVRGNTWRPSYDISEEKILALQEAAHEAVLAVYGPDHYTK